MLFSQLSQYFDRLENTASRLSMTQILSDLLTQTSDAEIGKICYLLQGRVLPLYEAVEFGMADRMMIKALARAYNTSSDEITELFKKEGDLGVVGQKLNSKLKTQNSKLKTQNSKLQLKTQNYSVNDVYNKLFELATTTGAGSVEKKVYILSELFKNLDSLSVRYVVRIPLSKLRLGFSDMTVLDALSFLTTGDKSARKKIEAAYNVRPDLGYIAETVKRLTGSRVNGLTGLKIKPVVGTPILMTRAERLGNTKEIINKIGKCAVEYKYDGFRLQIHFSKLKIKNEKLKVAKNEKLFEDEEPQEHVRLFSRNLEDVTAMYPDIVKGVVDQVNANEAILEGEAIAYNPKTGQFLPFQETVQRKRKYDITSKAKEIPLKLLAFELLYLDGESLLEKPFSERRKRLEKMIS